METRNPDEKAVQRSKLQDSEGGVLVMREDGVPDGAAGGQQPGLPLLVLLLQALQRQAQPWHLRRSAGRILLQAPFPAALQKQRQLRRGLRTQTAQRALGLQGDRRHHQDGIMAPPPRPAPMPAPPPPPPPQHLQWGKSPTRSLAF